LYRFPFGSSSRTPIYRLKRGYHHVFIYESVLENVRGNEYVHGYFVLLSCNSGIRSPCSQLLVSRYSVSQSFDRNAGKKGSFDFGDLSRRRLNDEAKSSQICVHESLRLVCRQEVRHGHETAERDWRYNFACCRNDLSDAFILQLLWNSTLKMHEISRSFPE